MSPSRFRRTLFVAALAWPFLAIGCADAGDPPFAGDRASDWSAIDAGAFHADFEVVRFLELEENEQARVVQPMVTAEGGELLLAEPMEGQVNVYGAVDGRLRRILGRRDGPGEFRLPVSARRTLDGSVAVVDFMSDCLAFFPPAEGEGAAAQMVDSPVQGIMDIRHLEGDRYLLAGLDGTGDPGRSQVFGVFLLAEGDIAIQSMQARERDPVWDLLIVGRSGAAEWKARNLPRLFAVESVQPNRWVVARRRAAQ